jgi:hypothetical protein
MTLKGGRREEVGEPGRDPAGQTRRWLTPKNEKTPKSTQGLFREIEFLNAFFGQEHESWLFWIFGLNAGFSGSLEYRLLHWYWIHQK